MPVYLPKPDRFAGIEQKAEEQPHIVVVEPKATSGLSMLQDQIRLYREGMLLAASQGFPATMVHTVVKLQEQEPGIACVQGAAAPTGSYGLSGVASTQACGTFFHSGAWPLLPFWAPGEGEEPQAEGVDLEKAYQRIGWWKGPQSPRDLRRESHAFWAQLGKKRIRWLVSRLRRERNIEVLQGAAFLLASLGPAIVAPILDELDGTPVKDNGLALLGALGKLSPKVGRANQTRLRNTLYRYLRHPLLELREAAAAATAILPAQRAVHLLQEALRVETDQVVRETLKDAIADRQGEQD